MNGGDLFTIAGVHAVDKRSRWQRPADWVLRRPPPTPVLVQFKITESVIAGKVKLERRQ